MDHADHDLDLAVELINTYWVLASPPDKLTDIGVYQRILADAGEHALAGQLGPDDLGELLVLRSQLGSVFAVGSVQAAVGILNPMLRRRRRLPPTERQLSRKVIQPPEVMARSTRSSSGRPSPAAGSRWGGTRPTCSAGCESTATPPLLGARLQQQAGVPLAISSDYPSGPLDPLASLRVATDRRLPDGRQLQPGQALTMQEAVRAANLSWTPRPRSASWA